MLEECELLRTLVFLIILAAHIRIMKSVSFNNMINSTEKLICWCINKGLPWHTSGTFAEVKNLAWLFNSYFFSFFFLNESADQLGCSDQGNHEMYILYVHTAQRSEFKHFSSFLLLQLSLICRTHFLMSTFTSLLISYEIHAIFSSWN